MKTYIITNRESGHCFGAYTAKDETGALDALAWDAGYADHAASVAVAGETDLEVREVSTLADFGRIVSGGVVQNDRGQGSAGPLWIGEFDESKAEEWDGVHTWLVTETEDPDAWRLAREAFEALGIEGNPEHVAVGISQGYGNPHQCIWAG